MMKKSNCANLKNGAFIELKLVIEEHFDSEFIKYKVKCENLLTERISSSKAQIISRKEECKTKDVIFAKPLSTLEIVSKKDRDYNNVQN